jgi:hypothetical protein
LKITARNIEEWAKEKDAQSALPHYVRRLMHSAGGITSISVPAGDSIDRPGWDGELVSESGDAWVPKGQSFWELSCDASSTSKANEDYAKRTKGTAEPIRKVSMNRPGFAGG